VSARPQQGIVIDRIERLLAASTIHVRHAGRRVVEKPRCVDIDDRLEEIVIAAGQEANDLGVVAMRSPSPVEQKTTASASDDAPRPRLCTMLFV
jgi:hypothetical protein